MKIYFAVQVPQSLSEVPFYIEYTHESVDQEAIVAEVMKQSQAELELQQSFGFTKSSKSVGAVSTLEVALKAQEARLDTLINISVE